MKRVLFWRGALFLQNPVLEGILFSGGTLLRGEGGGLIEEMTKHIITVVISSGRRNANFAIAGKVSLKIDFDSSSVISSENNLKQICDNTVMLSQKQP